MHNHKYFKLVSNPATQSSAHFGLESLTTAAQESRTMLAWRKIMVVELQAMGPSTVVRVKMNIVCK